MQAAAAKPNGGRVAPRINDLDESPVAAAENYGAAVQRWADERTPGLDDHRVMSITTPPAELTPGQRRFAEEHDATPGLFLPHAVLMYRGSGRIVCRWIVDGSGRCLDSVEFRRDA